MSRNNDTKYTYYLIEFEDIPKEEGEYTILEDIEEISGIINSVDIHLDDPERKAKVIVRGIGLTPIQFKDWQDNKIDWEELVEQD